MNSKKDLIVIRAEQVIEKLDLTSLNQVSEPNFKDRVMRQILYFAYGEAPEMNKNFCERVYSQIVFLLRYS
jgi:hypothetical protein